MKIFIIVLNLFTAFNFILMTSILMFRKNNTTANKTLATIIGIPVFSIVTNLLLYLDCIEPVFFLLYLTYFFNFLFGPSILYYFNLMVGRQPKFRWVYVFHFIPAIAAIWIMIQNLFLSESEKQLLAASIKSGNDDLYIIFNLLGLLHVLTYLLIGWVQQKKFKKELSTYFSNQEVTKFSWIKNFLKLFIILTVLILTAYIGTAVFLPSDLIIYADIITTPIVTFCIYFYVLYSAFNHHVVFSSGEYFNYKNQLLDFNEFTESETNKYAKSLLSEEDKQKIGTKLNFLLDEEKVFLNQTLDLKTLSIQVGVTPHQLSQYINSTFAKSFYDLINEYRVNEAKKMLISPEYQHLKIEAIGELAGFNSRASFFNVFKKHLKITPLGFKNDNILV